MKQSTNFQVIKIDTNPIKAVLTSEVYLVYHKTKKYIPALDIKDLHTNMKYSIWASAGSLAEQLEAIRASNNNTIMGAEIWIEKDGTDKFARYRLTEA